MKDLYVIGNGFDIPRARLRRRKRLHQGRPHHPELRRRSEQDGLEEILNPHSPPARRMC